MKVGVAFPSREAPADRDVIRRWAESATRAGADYLSFADHILGVDPRRQEAGWDRAWPHQNQPQRQPYDLEVAFHEAFVTMGFIAAVTDLELCTDVAVLPQRDTALFAKQAAQVDILTGGRLRLGVGVGWNAAEFAAIGSDFVSRGRRFEEQVSLIRQLWTEDAVTMDGTFHRMRAVGIRPLPVQRPIPLWFGGASPLAGIDQTRPLLERIGRLADGWSLDTGVLPNEAFESSLDVIRASAAAARRVGPFGVGAYLFVPHLSDVELADRVGRWAEVGATHVTLYLEGLGITSSADPSPALSRFVDLARQAA